MTKVKPQVIDDEQHEQVYERVAAVDVAKDSGMVCTRMPHPSRPGSRQSTVWTVKARMTAIGVLGRQLKRDGIQMVTLESTEVIWGRRTGSWRRRRSARRGRVCQRSSDEDRRACGAVYERTPAQGPGSGGRVTVAYASRRDAPSRTRLR